MYIFDFDFGYLKFGLFCDITIILRSGKNLILSLRIRSGNIMMNRVLSGNCWWSRGKFLLLSFIKATWGQMTSSEIINRFLLINHNWKELQTWAWSNCALLVKTNQLICSMAYFSQHVTSRDVGLRPNIYLAIQGHRVYVSTCLDDRKTLVPELGR